jgi:hypothetical protein
MIWLKSKKGFLMFAVTIIFMFIMVSAVVVFFVDRPDIESDMKLGKTLLKIYQAEEKSNEVSYFIEKSGEYALFNVLNDSINSGEFGGSNCRVDDGVNVMFSNDDCVFDGKNFKKKIVDGLNASFDKHVGKYLGEYGVSSKDFNFDVRFENNEIIIIGESKKQIQFSDDVREFNFKKNISFNESLDFNFSEYARSFEIVIDELICFEKFIGYANSLDVSTCFSDEGYFEFSEAEIVGDVLFYKYKMDGVLFEEEFVVDFAVDLKELIGVMGPQNIAFIT